MCDAARGTQTWVVEDFFTATADGETPSEWLERLLVKPHKDSGGGRSALPDIFPSIDCHTLFLPSTSRTLLQDLSAAKAGDLTPEFKEGVAELTKHIVERCVRGVAVCAQHGAASHHCLWLTLLSGNTACSPTRRCDLGHSWPACWKCWLRYVG